MLNSKRRIFIVCIMLLIGVIHLLPIGERFEGSIFTFYYSYFSDIVIPFGGYLLLCAAEVETRILRRGGMKLMVAFLVPAVAETCQYFGVPVLGSTFDPLDYVMYGIGVTIAGIFDIYLFPRLFDFWALHS